MPIHCCNCNCGDRCKEETELIDEKLKRLNLLRRIHKESLDDIEDDYQLEKLKDATHEIKKLIDKVDVNLSLLNSNLSHKAHKRLETEIDECKVCEIEKNKREMVSYLNKNCKSCSSSYYCCDCCKKTSDDEIIDLIRHKHSHHKDPNRYPLTTYPSALDKHCEKCECCRVDQKIKARRARSRSKSRSRSCNGRRQSICSCSTSDDDYNSSSSSYKPREPWRAGPYATNYPWKTWRLNESS